MSLLFPVAPRGLPYLAAVVSDAGFDNEAAEVACTQLGYQSLVSLRPPGYYSPSGLLRYVTSVICSGSETWLTDCSYTVVDGVDSLDEVGIKCGLDFLLELSLFLFYFLLFLLFLLFFLFYHVGRRHLCTFCTFYALCPRGWIMGDVTFWLGFFGWVFLFFFFFSFFSSPFSFQHLIQTQITLHCLYFQ